MIPSQGTHSRIKSAAIVGLERASTHRRVDEAGSVAKKGEATNGNVVVAGIVQSERSLANSGEFIAITVRSERVSANCRVAVRKAVTGRVIILERESTNGSVLTGVNISRKREIA